MSLYYCDKCGHLWQHDDETDDYCDICKNRLKPVPDEYFADHPDFKVLVSKEMEQKLINDLVLTSPNFDQYYFDNKDRIQDEQREKNWAMLEHGRAVLEGRDIGNQFGVSCPYCHATNVKRISYTSKALHTAVFGIFSMGRNSKEWHCNHCNSDF